MGANLVPLAVADVLTVPPLARLETGQSALKILLLNRAATDTVANGGAVSPLLPEEIPENASAAALFRYAV
jgi:hypothetical protein